MILPPHSTGRTTVTTDFRQHVINTVQRNLCRLLVYNHITVYFGLTRQGVQLVFTTAKKSDNQQFDYINAISFHDDSF